MRIRCDLHLNNAQRKLLLVSQREETLAHLALKLSAFLLFWDYNPRVELSLKHPALANQEFKPDLLALNMAGEIALWVECGNVSLHKLDKLTRRYPLAKLAVIKDSEAAGKRLRDDIRESFDRHERIEICSWPETAFKVWLGSIRETVHVIGESQERSLNIVINETPLVVNLASS